MPMTLEPIYEHMNTFYRTDDGVNASVRRADDEKENTKSSEEHSWDSGGEHGSWTSDRTRTYSDGSMILTEDTDSFIVGDRVWVGGTKPGVIAFIGETKFGPGDWAGIVLDEPVGKNDGTVGGIRYFQCAPNRGIFSRLTRLSRTPVDFSQQHQNTPTRSNGTPGTPSIPEHSVVGSSSSSSTTYWTPHTEHSQKTHAGSPDLKVGDRVIVKSSHGSKAGILQYYGNTEFAPGLWCGVELDDPLGKNDGSVNGVKYFDCAPKFGLFVPAEKVSRSPVNAKKSSPCVVHPAGISRQGTQDSFRSVSSIATTTASSMKSSAAATRVRLGVNSLRQKQGTPTSATTPVPHKSPLQVRVVKVYYPDWEPGYY